MEERKNITLSIETAIDGGSISLFRDAFEIDHWIGTREISKSVDILEEANKVLDRNNLKKRTIKKIVVSRGAGSHTGIRVGMAIGLGLKQSLNCELVEVDTHAALFSAFKRQNKAGEVITALPVGKNLVSWQIFKIQDRDNESTGNSASESTSTALKSQISTLEVFSEHSKNKEAQRIEALILHNKLYLDLTSRKEKYASDCQYLVNVGENIARITAAASLLQTAIERSIFKYEDK